MAYCFQNNFAAGEKNDLEPFSSPELLEELESWSAQITGDPLISCKISDIETDSDFAVGSEQQALNSHTKRPTRLQGPRP